MALLDDGSPPRELFDPHAACWQTRGAFRQYMASRGWDGALSSFWDWFDGSPWNRMAAATDEWALRNGVTIARNPHLTDWHKLRDMGLLPEPSRKRD